MDLLCIKELEIVIGVVYSQKAKQDAQCKEFPLHSHGRIGYSPCHGSLLDQQEQARPDLSGFHGRSQTGNVSKHQVVCMSSQTIRLIWNEDSKDLQDKLPFSPGLVSFLSVFNEQ